ncbi:MAG: 2-phospho-L-lactate guanylyltransferase [Alphaproteobacteria bacterium]
MTVALIPMKDLADAKQRLSTMLSDEERMGLVNAMLRDVLAALNATAHIEHVSIIAQDQSYLDFGVDVIEEANNTGYNEAVTFALSRPALADFDSLLILPGDVPLTSPGEIDALAAPTTEPTVRLAAARDGGGTNGLMIAPPRLLDTAFGIGSFERHTSIAKASGAKVDIVTGSGISFDIDTPDDLIAFCAVDGTSETHTFLDLSGIRGRLLAENV